MRIAICLHGKIGDNHWKNNHYKYHSVEGYYEIKKNILDIYPETDVFIHCWNDSDERSSEILKLYQPKKFKCEKQLIFSDLTDQYHRNLVDSRIPQLTQNIASNWYSLNKSDLLRQAYESENNFKYDCVIHSRFDIKIEKFSELSKYNFTEFHVLDCHQSSKPQKYKNSFIDYFFFSNSSNMTKFANLYNDIKLCFDTSIKTNRGIHNFFNHYASGFYARHQKLNIKMLRKSDICVNIFRNAK